MKTIWILAIVILMTGTASANNVYNEDKEINYTTIQAAIDDADIGNTIIVDKGLYNENLDIYKTINLTGPGKDNTTIIAVDSSDYTVDIRADRVNVSGFTIRNATTNPPSTDWKYYRAGIYIKYANNINIKNNNVSNNLVGIFLYNSQGDNISENIVMDNIFDGIYVIEFSNKNNITENVIHSNYGKGISVIGSYNNILTNNLIYDNRFDAGISLTNSMNNNVINNNVSNNHAGISLANSGNIDGVGNNSIINNIVDSNQRGGIYSQFSNNNYIIGNNISQNNDGIGLYGGSRYIIKNNFINSNSHSGIYLYTPAIDNIIYDNFLYNENNFGTDGYNINLWNLTKIDGVNIIGGSYIGGNYWTNPSGTGFSQTCTNRGDGFCDKSYELDSANIDQLPLAEIFYNFTGFFQPIDNIPVWNSVKAGAAIPVKFSLDGDQGLDIFSTGYPVSTKITCDSKASLDIIDDNLTTGANGISYNSTTNQYSYIWKTDKSWSNSCRQLIILLKDGRYHNASFNFK